MIEQEAKTKWCPFARVAKVDVGIGYNRWVDGIGESIASNSRCIGSACMAWRSTDNETAPFPPGEPEPPSMPAGYCGLAGKP